MSELKIGSKAPTFSLLDQDGEKVSLKDIKEDFIVLFFYPKDNTPGCTVEAQSFTKLKKKYENSSIKVLGLSGLDQKSKKKFCEKASLDVTLLSDTDGAIGLKYDTYGEKTFMGRKYTGFHRKTFVIGKDRKILKIYDKVKPEGHADEVLKDLKEFL